jgi:hypothetical protein
LQGALFSEYGRGKGIRTPDILLPKQARYRTALYPGLKFGSATRTRTWDPMINSHLLYRLSYRGTINFKYNLLQFRKLYRYRFELFDLVHRCVHVSEARYSTIFKTLVNP